MVHYCLNAAQSHSRNPASSTAVFPSPPLLSLSLFSICSGLSCPTLLFVFPKMCLIYEKFLILLISTEGKRENSGVIQDYSCHFHYTLYTFSFPFLFHFMFFIPSFPVSWGGHYTNQLSFLFLGIFVLCQWRTSIFLKSLGIKKKEDCNVAWVVDQYPRSFRFAAKSGVSLITQIVELLKHLVDKCCILKQWDLQYMWAIMWSECVNNKDSGW